MLSPAVGWPERRRTSEPLTTNVFPMHLSGETPTTPLRRGFGPLADVRRGSGAEPERRREFFNERYVLLDIRNCGESQRDSYNQSTAVWPGTADFCSRETTEAGKSRRKSVFCAREGANAAFLYAPEVFKERCAGRRTFRALIGVVSAGISGGVLIRVGAGTPGGSGRDGARADVARGRAKLRAGKSRGPHRGGNCRRGDARR